MREWGAGGSFAGVLDILRSRARFVPFAWSVLAYNVAASAWGAFVRATGSGAGCGEHWPDCNGEVVPRSAGLETIIEFTHRVTAGLATVLVVALAVWAWRAFPKGHGARFGAGASVGFIFSEAIIGAGLVLFGLTKNDASLLRAAAMGTHLLNTFLLLAALAVTATFASPASPRAGTLDADGPFRSPASPHAAFAGARAGSAAVLWTVAVPLALLVCAGATGAIAALGDTLFHATSLAEGLKDDAATGAHLFVRLRGLHPLLAGLAAVATLASVSVMTAIRGSARVARAGKAVRIAVLAQVVAGVVNLVLLAPVGMQIVHLVLADVVWIAVVVMGARGMMAPRAEAEARSIEEEMPLLSPGRPRP